MSDSQEVILGLDTSASPLLVAVQRGEKHLSRRRKGIKQERLLFAVLTRALGALGGGLKEVKKICIVRGPGRFTGIRIALTFASMMQYLNHTQVYGATVFDIVRRQTERSRLFKRFKTQHPDGVLAVVLHAFREEYFLQFFDGPLSAPAWLSREELLARLAGYGRPLLLAGADKDGANLAALTQNRYPLAADKDGRVRAETLLELAQDDSFKQQALEPLYLKPARFELITPQ